MCRLSDAKLSDFISMNKSSEDLEKSSFFAAPKVVTEFSVAWCLSIVGQVAKASYTRCLLGVRNNFASLGIVNGAELLFE